jgi:uncharacterized protein
MLKRGEISGRIYDYLVHHARHASVKDVRIGLGYVAIALEDDRTGLGAVLLQELTGSCESVKAAGALRGADSADFLKLLVDGKSALEKAIGLATANALIEVPPPFNTRDALEIADLGIQDQVAMVGFFPPLVKRIQEKGISLTVLERNPHKAPLLEEAEKQLALQECSVAIITATTLLNDTLEEVLNDLGDPRHVALLGPSTPMIMDVFKPTTVNHLGGAIVADPQKVLQIVSEGGGTPAMRPYLHLVNIVWSQK